MFKKPFQRIGFLFQNSAQYPVDLPKVEQIINYRFRDKTLLLTALTHRSYLNQSHQASCFSNERLEFLGDAVLGLIVTDYLYHSYDKENEGDLSSKKSVLVSRKVLGRVIEELEIGQFLLVDHGEEKTGGRNRLSNLANLFEALLGAIYLDGGFKAAEAFVELYLLPRSTEFLAASSYFNYKSALLEYTQGKGWGAPQYRIVSESGPDHDKRFVVTVNVQRQFSARGSGRSKKKAEQQAARSALQKIRKKAQQLADKETMHDESDNKTKSRQTVKKNTNAH